MQIIFEDEDEKGNSGGTDPIDSVIYTGRISKCVKRKYVRRFGSRENRI